MKPNFYDLSLFVGISPIMSNVTQIFSEIYEHCCHNLITNAHFMHVLKLLRHVTMSCQIGSGKAKKWS